MSGQPAVAGNKVGKCMLYNWVEERAVAALDSGETVKQIQRHGHRGILTLDQESKIQTLTTHKATYIPLKGPGVRLQGVRRELLEKEIAKTISEEIQAEKNRPALKTNICSTTQQDFCVEGFGPVTPETSQQSEHDYRSEQAVTYWSENCQRVQGVTGVQTPNAPFRKWAKFSTPIGERLDEVELPPDN